MNISEKQLRETIIRVLARIEAEEGLFPVTKKKKIYMVCTGGWDERYLKFLRTGQTDRETVIPVLTEKLRISERRGSGRSGGFRYRISGGSERPGFQDSSLHKRYPADTMDHLLYGSRKQDCFSDLRSFSL